MNANTRQRLNAINRTFYATTAPEFDATRAQPWPGWKGVLDHLDTNSEAPLSVLDVGCGNGRFARFLASALETRPLRYHGVDNNPALLAIARQTLDTLPQIDATLGNRDVILSPPEQGLYDLVVAFGLLHHVPGADFRRAFMTQLAERVAPGGLLAFACWRFAEYERFQQRIVPWPDDFPVAELDADDYLLDWRRGESALRYCHHVNDAEHAALIQATGLTELTTYRADGFTGDVNCYSLLKK